MNSTKETHLVLWTIFSVCVSAFLSFIGLMFVFVRTLDIHKNSSAPGDFAQTPASIILTDILVNWGIASFAISFVAWIGFVLTKDLTNQLSTSSNHRKVSKFLHGLFVLNVFILCLGSIYGSVVYYLERAPYFPN